MEKHNLLDAIKGAQVHKNVGKYIRSIIEPNISLKKISKLIEEKIKEEVKYDSDNPLNAGIAFPVGLSLNNCAAHYTPNYYENDITLKSTDILKIDYGVHFNGIIIDSAFTMHFDNKYDEFINISRKLTNYAVSLCGPDAILGDIGKDIEEYIYSKEIEIDGKLYQLRTMSDLSGHAIAKYEIHAGKAVPNIAINYPLRMKDYEYYAIEPFITTGDGKTILKEPNSHFMMNKNYKNNAKKIEDYDEKFVYDLVDKYYYTLPFCQKWLYEYNNSYNYDNILKKLESKKILQSYPPIYDINGSIISQFEHTIFVKENGIINLTTNDFY
jgi:methionyl aminopeptidase